MDEYSRYFWSGDRQVSVTVQRRFRACTSLRKRQSFSVSYILMRLSCWNAAAVASALQKQSPGMHLADVTGKRHWAALLAHLGR